MLYYTLLLRERQAICYAVFMHANEKTALWTVLKTASDCLYGYASPDFSETPPHFADDTDKTARQANTAAQQSAIALHPHQSFNQSGEAHTPLHEPQELFAFQQQSDNMLDFAQQQNDNGLPSVQTAPATLESIAQKIAACTRCELSKRRTNVVPGMGVQNPAVLVVGEGPGAEEDAQGLPFVGPAGKLLDKMLAAISLDRNVNCYIANIVKCRPPNNRTPFPEEAEACMSFLEAQIHILKPKMILAAGRTAAQNLLKTTSPLGQLRSRFFVYNTIPLLVTYHPSALLRNESLKRPAWEDLKLFRTKLTELVPDYAAHLAHN